jgi:hypothetical protein
MKRRSLGKWVRTSSTLLLSLGVGALMASACTPVSREFPGGQGGTGGAGGNGRFCEPGTTAPCYSGAPGTEDVGACKKGTHTCLPTGDAYDECAGEVVPIAEICTTPIDEGCDGPNPVQCPSLGHAWSKSFGGTGEDLVTAIAVDPATGDVIGTGYFAEKIDFGGDPMVSTGGNDIFLFRFTADGKHLWSKRFGDASSQMPNALALDATGNIYVAGEMDGSVDFGDGKPVTSKGSQDAFVAKFDPDGKVVWSKLFGDSMSQRAKSIAITPTNQIIVGGTFYGFIPLTGMELPSNGNSQDIFIIRLDSSGFDIGGKKYGSPNSDELMDIAVDSKGAVLVTGSFADTIDFGSLGLFPSAGDGDAFVLKLNPDLSESWVRQYGDALFQRGGSVVASPNDDVFLMGDFTGSITLGDGSSLMAAPQQRAVFLMSLNTDGAFRWGKSTGNSQGFFARQMMTVDPSSQAIIAVGFFDGTLDFGGGPLVTKDVDAFATKIGWDGSHISSARFGGPLIDAFFDVAVSPTGDTFVCGAHQGPVDYGGGILESPAAPDDIQALLMRLLP